MKTTQHAIRFIQPTLYVLVSFCIAMYASQGTSQSTSGLAKQIDFLSFRIKTAKRPSPSLSPDEVVRLQLTGLKCPDQALGVLQCMNFASPDNVAGTGPLDRFGRMVRSAEFSMLGDHDEVLIGQTIFLDGRARVLVTLVKEQELHSFVWVLSRQEKAPFERCWMTDGVFPVRFGERIQDEAKQSDDVI